MIAGRSGAEGTNRGHCPHVRRVAICFWSTLIIFDQSLTDRRPLLARSSVQPDDRELQL